MPNDYTRAYESYCNDVETPMPLEEFKKSVHKWDDETLTYDYPEYVKMVDTLTDEIDMIDPSGGPYLHSGYDMGMFDESFKGMIVEEFKSVPEGYLIKIKLNDSI